MQHAKKKEGERGRTGASALKREGEVGNGVFPVCCFVLLIPTPMEYRVPRVNPGVTASKLFPPLLPSLATPGPPLPYRPLQKSRYYYPRSEWVQHLP